MKYVLCLVCMLSLMPGILPAQQKQFPKLSPLTQLYLRKAEQARTERLPEYVYREGADHQTYISALIKVKKDFSGAALNDLGVKVGTKAGDIWTAQIPLSQVKAFTETEGIEYIQLDEPALPTLDSARKATKVDSVQAGYGLTMPYSGDGVVVGIVDAGFDYGHPTLFDTTGVGYRVRRIWEQKKTGTPPSNFTFGNELTDSAAMWAAQTDNYQTHGTHVTGIAAGGGFENEPNGNNIRYRGMAYRSDLVFVGITPPQSQWINTGCSDIIDGISYVYQYATSQSKPAVVNLSWGSPLGPRDGTGLFSQACDNLTGPGKIFVCSAGNNGDNKIHIQKTFSGTDTIVHTFVSVPQTPIGKRTWVDIWGDTAQSFCVNVRLFNGLVPMDSTDFVCLDNNTHSFYLVGTSNDTCYINMVTSSAEFNMKPRIFLEIYTKTLRPIGISIKGQEGTVNMWSSYVYQTTGYYGAFAKNAKPWAVDGTSDMTISDIAATKSAITVGAYASKTSYNSIGNGAVSYASYVAKGDLAPFSSRGPTADGRIKPDIIGPGLVLGSAISSYDSTFFPGGDDYVAVETIFNNPRDGRNYPYGMLMGTSMSSPAVSGIVALMLQANPLLNPQLIKEVFAQTAITDNFTGTISAAGNNTWGHGKVNAYAAVKRSEQLVGIGPVTQSALQCNIYPNPNPGSFTVEYTGNRTERLRFDVYDMTGRVVASDNWEVHEGYNQHHCTMTQLAKGIYVARLASGKGYAAVRLLID